jgi:hypothetical protein
MKLSKYFIIGLAALFFGLSFQALKDAQPAPKNMRIYKELKTFMPYYLEKRVGGFQIRMKNSSVKEKPPITEVYKRLDQLEQGWGKKFLQLSQNNLLVKDKNGTVIKTIVLKAPEEKLWVQTFFGIK